MDSLEGVPDEKHSLVLKFSETCCATLHLHTLRPTHCLDLTYHLYCVHDHVGQTELPKVQTT